MKAIFTKDSNGIIPNNEESLALFDKIPHGALVQVEYIKTRNYGNHKRFFAMVRICFNMQEHFDNEEVFRKHLLMIGGHFDEVIVPNRKGGTIVQYWPKSIEFSEMDEIEFNKLFSACITGFISRYGNGMEESDLLKIIEFD